MPLKNKIIFLNEISSTNDFAKINFEKLENGTVISAEIQNSGRGQHGRSWLSFPDDLKISLVIKEKIDLRNIYDFSLIPAAAIMRLLNKLCIESKIKWPNDIIVQDKKIAGILVETSFMSNKLNGIIIGIGLNVSDYNHKDLINYTSLKNLIKKVPNKMDLIDELIRSFNYFFHNYLDNGIERVLNYCNDNSYLFNKVVKFEDKYIKIKNLDKLGKLHYEYNLRDYSIDAFKFSLRSINK